MLRTQKQRDELCRSCPIAKVADIMGDPCSLLIVRDLLDEPRRFSDLNASLGMSTRTLTKGLRRLESEGIIKRVDYKRTPPRVEYRLTAKGRALNAIVEEMRAYGKKYL